MWLYKDLQIAQIPRHQEVIPPGPIQFQVQGHVIAQGLATKPVLEAKVFNDSGSYRFRLIENKGIGFLIVWGEAERDG